MNWYLFLEFVVVHVWSYLASMMLMLSVNTWCGRTWLSRFLRVIVPSSAPMPSRFAVLAWFNIVTNADTNLGVYVLERQIRDFATTGSLRSASPQCGNLGPRTTDLGTTVLKKYYRVSIFSHKFSMDLHGCSSMCHIFSLISYGFSLIPLIFINFR